MFFALPIRPTPYRPPHPPVHMYTPPRPLPCTSTNQPHNPHEKGRHNQVPPACHGREAIATGTPQQHKQAMCQCSSIVRTSTPTVRPTTTRLPQLHEPQGTDSVTRVTNVTLSPPCHCAMSSPFNARRTCIPCNSRGQGAYVVGPSRRGGRAREAA